MKKFETPKLNVLAFEIEDIITTSGAETTTSIDEGEGTENMLPIG